MKIGCFLLSAINAYPEELYNYPEFFSLMLSAVSAVEGMYHTNRLAKIHGNIQVSWETVGASQEEDYSEM